MKTFVSISKETLIFDHNKTEVVLYEGDTAVLDEKSDFINGLVANKRIKLADAQETKSKSTE